QASILVSNENVNSMDTEVRFLSIDAKTGLVDLTRRRRAAHRRDYSRNAVHRLTGTLAGRDTEKPSKKNGTTAPSRSWLGRALKIWPGMESVGDRKQNRS